MGIHVFGSACDHTYTIGVVGCGYVGLIAAAAFAFDGHDVHVVDLDENKIEGLRNGKLPFYEPDLPELFNIARPRMSFHTDAAACMASCDVVFIAVGTPCGDDGNADLTAVHAVARTIAPMLKPSCVVAIRSTVPPGTARQVKWAMKEVTSYEFPVMSCPEFLAEGTAVTDMINPSRLVIGGDNAEAMDVIENIFQNGIERTNCQVHRVNNETAELAKYANNCFLAARVSLINEFARIAERKGASITDLAKVIGSDDRIGPRYLQAGIGYGGSCLPKDTKAIRAFSKDVYGMEHDSIVNAVIEGNDKAIAFGCNFTMKCIGKLNNIVVVGLAFKPETDDTRYSASIALCNVLVSMGKSVRVVDHLVEDRPMDLNEKVSISDDYWEAINNAEAVVVCTAHESFRSLNWSTIQNPLKVVDLRNVLDESNVTSAGHSYFGFCAG